MNEYIDTKCFRCHERRIHLTRKDYDLCLLCGNKKYYNRKSQYALWFEHIVLTLMSLCFIFGLICGAIIG